jgi:hypothetical protein
MAPIGVTAAMVVDRLGGEGRPSRQRDGSLCGSSAAIVARFNSSLTNTVDRTTGIQV